MGGSPPTWGRGLKHMRTHRATGICRVAPHVGAWIETKRHCHGIVTALVAPHVGAWIETKRHCHGIVTALVAPHVGAWIETTKGCWPM